MEQMLAELHVRIDEFLRKLCELYPELIQVSRKEAEIPKKITGGKIIRFPAPCALVPNVVTNRGKQDLPLNCKEAINTEIKSGKKQNRLNQMIPKRKTSGGKL